MKAEQYFQYYQTPDNLKVDVATMYLEGEALDLFAWFKSDHQIIYWDDLVKLLQENFGPEIQMNIYVQLSKVGLLMIIRRSLLGVFLVFITGQNIVS